MIWQEVPGRLPKERPPGVMLRGLCEHSLPDSPDRFFAETAQVQSEKEVGFSRVTNFPCCPTLNRALFSAYKEHQPLQTTRPQACSRMDTLSPAWW